MILKYAVLICRSYVDYNLKCIFRRTLRSPYGASRPSVVCRLRRSCDVLSGL